MSDITRDAIDELIGTGTAVAEADDVHATEDELIAAVYRMPGDYRAEIVDLEKLRAPLRPGPRRKAGNYQVSDVASFLAYFGKHAGPNPETWVGESQIVSVLDAHGDDPRWEGHRLVLKLQHSPEWSRWVGVSGKWQRQEDFAELIEDAAVDVVNPDAATMLEIAGSLQANTKVEFKSAFRTSDGQTALRYEETTTAKAGTKGELEIPQRIGLMLRVYLGQEPVPVSARFRYRIRDGVLALSVVLDRVPDLVEEARDSVVQQITEATDRGIVLRGLPH